MSAQVIDMKAWLAKHPRKVSRPAPRTLPPAA